MYSVKVGEYVFEFEEPAGPKGRAVFRLAAAVIADCNHVPPVPGMDRSELSRNQHRFVMQLASHPLGEKALADTFADATINGQPFSMALVNALPLRLATVPWEALAEAWGRLGFLGDSTRTLIELGDELKNRMRNREEGSQGTSPTPKLEPSKGSD